MGFAFLFIILCTVSDIFFVLLRKVLAVLFNKVDDGCSDGICQFDISPVCGSCANCCSLSANQFLFLLPLKRSPVLDGNNS